MGKWHSAYSLQLCEENLIKRDPKAESYNLHTKYIIPQCSFALFDEYSILHNTDKSHGLAVRESHIFIFKK